MAKPIKFCFELRDGETNEIVMEATQLTMAPLEDSFGAKQKSEIVEAATILARKYIERHLGITDQRMAEVRAIAQTGKAAA